jgi:hypothetical protein
MIVDGPEMTPEYQQTAEEVVGALGSDALRGLTNTEARARLHSTVRMNSAQNVLFRFGESFSRSSETRSSSCC